MSGAVDFVSDVVGSVAGVVSPVLGIASSVLGLTSGMSAGADASDAARSSSALTDVQSAIAKEQWNRYMSTFAPVEDQLATEAVAPVEDQPGFSRMMSTIDRGYADTAANTRRTLAGRYENGSGIEGATQTALDLNRTTAKTGAVADLNQDRFNNMLQVANIGQGNVATASNTAGSAGINYGNLAAMYGNAANQSYASAGNTLSNLMQMYTAAQSPASTYSGSGTYNVTPSAENRWTTWH